MEFDKPDVDAADQEREVFAADRIREGEHPWTSGENSEESAAGSDADPADLSDQRHDVPDEDEDAPS